MRASRWNKAGGFLNDFPFTKLYKLQNCQYFRLIIITGAVFLNMNEDG